MEAVCKPQEIRMQPGILSAQCSMLNEQCAMLNAQFSMIGWQISVEAPRSCVKVYFTHPKPFTPLHNPFIYF